jgi:hypothetical protein
MANNTSPHILGTSANLLGFCLFVITSLHIANQTETNLIDEFTSLVALLLTISCTFSFISVRTKYKEKGKFLEIIAEYFFFVSLLGIFVIILFIAMKFL